MTNRRQFIQTASAAALALAFPYSLTKQKRMGIVVHSYWSRWESKVGSKTFPAFTTALDLLEHAHRIGAGGIQVGVGNWTADLTKKMRERTEQFDMYIEGSISPPQSPADMAKFEQGVVNAKQAGASIIRTVASTGRRYEILHSKEAFEQSKTEAIASLRLAEPVLEKHKMKLAVENHKDWFAGELVDILKKIGSDWIGVTLDFGNSMALLEDPMEVVTTLAPFSFSTHVKDMGVEEYKDGFLLSEVPLGKGILDLQKMVSVCQANNSKMKFSLEMITRDPLEIPYLTDGYWATRDDGQRAATSSRIREMVSKNFKTALPRVSTLTPEQRLAREEENIVACLAYSNEALGLK